MEYARSTLNFETGAKDFVADAGIGRLVPAVNSMWRIG